MALSNEGILPVGDTVGFVSNPPVNIFMSISSPLTDITRKEIGVGDIFPIENTDEKAGQYVFNSNSVGFKNLTYSLKKGEKPYIELKIDDPGSEFLQRVLSFNAQNELQSRSFENELIASGGADLRPIVSIAFGIGSDSRFWAGPFQTQVSLAVHGFDDNAVEYVTLSLMPFDYLNTSISLYKALKDLGFSQETDSYTLSLSNFSYKIGNIKFKDSGVYEEKFTPQGVLDGVYELIAGEDGLLDRLEVKNRLLLLPSKLEKKLESTFSASSPRGIKYIDKPGSGKVEKVFRSIYLLDPNAAYFDIPKQTTAKFNAVAQTLTSMGLNVIYPEFPGGDIIVKIDPEYKKKFNFYKFIYKFFNGIDSTLSTNENLIIYFESNKEIIKLLKESENFGEYIIDEDHPVLIIGNPTNIKEMIYGEVIQKTTGTKIPKPTKFDKNDEKYLNNIRTYLNNKQKTDNYYVSLATGGAVDPTDDPNSTTNETKNTGTLINFEANTVNSNIISYQCLNDAISYDAYKASPKAEVEEALKELEAKYGNIEIMRESGTYDPDLTKMAEIFGKATKKPIYSINSDDCINEKRLYASFLDALTKSAVQLRIRTLPFFNLSDVNLLNSLCNVLINKNPDANQRFREPFDNYINLFYSGVYIITGFTHVINEKEAYSEFELVKDVKPKKSDSLPTENVKQ